jgi:hypothetical protein
MNYGNANDLIKNCPLCARSIDKHQLSLIRSDDNTEKLAKKLQQALDGVVKGGALKGLPAPRGTCMVGAATAKIGSTVHTFATISGADTGILNLLNGNTLGGGVTLVKDASALPLTTIAGRPLTMAPIAQGRNRDYPVGSCAAQKLLMAIFRKQSAKAKASEIRMAEILWSDPGAGTHNRDWSTGSVVCSCDTCKRVVPAMLCDHGE